MTTLLGAAALFASPSKQSGIITSSAATVGNRPALEVPENFEATPQLSAGARISMVTIYPGEALYSTFGHTAIRIWDPLQGIDLLFNYGQSSVPFDSGFVPNFVGGYLPFMLGVIDTERAYNFYRNVEDRSIVEQDLDLSLGKKRELYRFLSYNALPENRIYIYDFFFDNCTTRIRDLFTLLYGDSLRYRLPEAEPSFREAISPYLRGQAYVRLGIDLMFGFPSDSPPELTERLYLPFQLMDAVAEAKVVRGADGSAEQGRPIEAGTGFVYRQERGEPEPPAIPPQLTLWLFSALLFLLSIPRLRYCPVARVGDIILFSLVGVLGTAMLLLWIFSGYEMTTGNFNLLWAWPLHLVAGFLPYRITSGSGIKAKITRYYFGIAATLSLLYLITSPLNPQTLPAAAVPLLLALGLRAALRLPLQSSRPGSEDYA